MHDMKQSQDKTQIHTLKKKKTISLSEMNIHHAKYRKIYSKQGVIKL